MSKDRTRARVISYFLVVIVLTHTAVIALWAGPSNPIKRLVGTSKIRSYVNPVFEQDWHIFAPTPKRVTSELEFRARVVDSVSHELIETPWYSLTDGENLMILHNPSPTRAAFAARRTALPLHNAAQAMNGEQREVIEMDFLEAGGEGLPHKLRGVSDSEGAGESEVTKFLRYDQMATTLATLSAASIHEGHVAEVQFRTKKASVPKFSERHSRTLADVKRVEIDYGWRLAPAVSTAEVASFAPYAKYVLRAEAESE